jgi:mRNA interferase RelE/StbE
VGDRYAVVYRPEAVIEDLPSIPRNVQVRILRAIERRLMTEPTKYGERLRRSLAGLWKLRVGDYRVCYEIHDRTVMVWAIHNRRDVYAMLQRRRPA